ncbi:MAG: phage tail sheath protein, partial [Frankiales bacterium]|nr:phage tail sheath protein [Frankiales bacterium]
VATAIQTASKLVNASAVAGATLAVDPNPVPFAGNDVAAQATVGALTFTGASPGSFMNGWTVSLTPAGAAPGQAATHVTVTLTDPATTPPTTVEVLPNLPLDGLADLISSKSSFLRATAVTPAPAPVPVPPAESAPTALPFGGGVTPNLVTGVAGQQATVMLPGGPQLTALAKSETQNSWQAALAADPDNTGRLELTIAAGPAPATTIETLSNLPTDPQALAIAITSQSAQVMVALSAPLEGGADAPWSETTFTQAVLTELGYSTEPGPPPVPPLDQIAPNHFNLMCIPDAAWLQLGNQTAIFSTALQFCTDRQAFLLVDPPPPVTAPVPDRLGGAAPWLQIEQGIGANPADQQKLLAQWAPQFIGPNSYAAAAYYPWVEIPDPNNNFLPIAVPPSGTIAGVYASTDVSRGVWKAPAGVAATLVGVTQLADVSINDDVDGQLNSLGINCLRTFPLYQRVAWGSRTLAGSDLIDTAFKYVPARRLADYIELSLQQSLLWTVFEPNEETLWSSIVAEIMPFMMGLYGSGAFMGATAAQAFSVACDATTTTPADMLAGVVNVQIGFQPVDPAEFVVLNVKVGALSTPAT